MAMAIILIPCLACRAGTHAEEDAPSVSCTSCGVALPSPGEAAWLMTRSGADQYGPYTLAQLADYIAERRILPGDGIWHAGASVRLNASQLPPFGAVASAPSPVPAPAPAPVAAAPVVPQRAPAAVAPQAVAEAPPVYAPAPASPVYAPTPAYAVPQQGRAGLHIKRAFKWNLRELPVEPDEEAQLIAQGVDEPDARRYLVWRRSVLLVVAIPTLISALLAALGTFTADMSAFSGTGILAELLRLAALFVLPLTAWLAARAWDQHRRSRTILLRGWLVAFLTPLLLALIPFSWRIDLSGARGDTNAIAQVNNLLGLVGAISVYVTLMPAVLSLIPGVLRGCLRIKALIPQSVLPGLFLVAATPLYVLLFLVIFTTVNQVAGNFLLILGVLALLGAPLLYLVNARTFTRPLHTEEEVARIGAVQQMVLVIVAIGVALIVLYAFTAEILGKSLIGTSQMTSIVRPWSPSLIQFPIEYIVRSLFTTVLVADLFMLMNLQLWRHTKEFQDSPEAASYDRLMSEIEEAGAAPQPAAAPTA